MKRPRRRFHRASCIGVIALAAALVPLVMGSDVFSQTAGAASAPEWEPVAQRAVLYEEDSGNARGKIFAGSTTWRAETLSIGRGEPPELVIRATVEIPERQIAMTWMLAHNNDAGLSASHIVELQFKLPTDFRAGGIANVPGLFVNQTERTNGTPLGGIAVKVIPDYFMIALSLDPINRGRNVELLIGCPWIGVPLVYANRQRAILAMDKSAPVARLFGLAFSAWASAPGGVGDQEIAAQSFTYCGP